MGVAPLRWWMQKTLYIGTIAPQDILAGMSFFSSIRSPGAVLGIQIRQEDYSLAEISRLTEENEAKILSLSMIQSSDDPHQLYLVLKLSVQDGAAVRKTLTRHGYQVFHHQVVSDQNRSTRSEKLQVPHEVPKCVARFI